MSQLKIAGGHLLRLRAIALALRVLRLRAIALALRVLRLRAIALALRVLRLRAIALALRVLRLRAIALALRVLRLRAIALALRVLRLRAIALALRVLRLRAIALALRVLPLQPNNPLLQQNFFVFVWRIVEHDNPAFSGEFTDFATAFKELVGIEVFRPCSDKVRRRTIEMNKCESALTGNDGILPVYQKNLFVREHVEGFVERAGGREIIARIPSVGRNHLEGAGCRLPRGTTRVG